MVQAALDAASQGCTTIVIAHRLLTIKGAANIVVMLKGRIVEQCTHEDLTSRAGVYPQPIEAQRAYEASTSFTCEATASIKTIASLTRDDNVWQKYHSMLVDQTSNSLWSVLRSFVLYGLSQAGMFLASDLGFWYGGTLISNGELSIEGFFICFAAVVFGAQSTGGIFSFAPDMGKSKQVADSLKSLFERVPEIDSWSTEGETVKNLEGAIKFRDVHFRYPTRPTQPVLRGISLKIDLGQYVALVGPSGCGKSAIVSLMERFYDPKIGSILLDGRDISQLNLKAFRSRIGHVSQEPVLYSGTIKENILLGGEGEANEAVARACKDANIYDFIVGCSQKSIYASEN